VKREILKEISKQLDTFSETPALDAQVLLAHITGKSRAWLLAHPELNLSPAEEKKLNNALSKLKNDIPLPYVIGHWEFFGLELHISDAVLIPRPETEELVEYALDWLRANDGHRVLDVGTGSGCIPISLARNAPDLNVVGVDISSSALDIARQNAQKHEEGLHHKDRKSTKFLEKSQRKTFKINSSEVQFIQSNLFSNFPVFQRSTFNLILANLPYIPTKTLKTLDVYHREPTLALDGGADGLDWIRQLLTDAPRYLSSKGAIMLEIDSSHGEGALALADEFFPESKNELVQDLSGRDRFIIIQT
jgi:release factor glutamine methyltransferase